MPPLNELLRQRTQGVIGLVNSHRVLLYTSLSTLAVAAAIGNALRNNNNFYSLAIYLSKSGRSVLIFANFAFLFALVCGHIVQKIFFGSLRPNEVERLYDRLWFFITESLLAFTIFRDEFDMVFALMFGFLLFVKSFHWLAGDRIEWMDQRPYPGPSLLFHVRMTVLFLILWATDFMMFLLAVESTLSNGVGGMILFASEYGILMASITNTMSKYLLTSYELRRAGQRGGENAPPWENKSMWTFYIDLTTDFLKLTIYLVFFSIIITLHGLPLNIVRDVYLTARSFISRLRALHRYQAATRNMDQRYPNATEEDLNPMSDRTCIICREEMIVPRAQPDTPGALPNEGPNTTPKKLPCGHIFHFHCLRSWLERQQSCPTCRRTVLDANPATAQAPAGGVQPPRAPPPPGVEGNLGGGLGQNPRPQAQGGDNPVDNPVGLMNRLLGGVPPAPAQNPAPPVANGPNPVHGVGQPAAVVIQYHIQYQQQRQAAVLPTPVAGRPPLHPVPQFAGFHGPGGQWQAWPGNVAQAPPPDPATSNATPTSGPSRTQAAPDGTRETPAEQTAPGPREAAGLAALRRLQQGAESRGTSSSSPETSRPGANEGREGRASSRQRLDIPRLVPLYDPTPSPGNVRPPYGRGTSVNPSLAQSGRPSPRPVVSGDPRFSQSFSTSRTPLSQLPQTMTDAQLAVMDQVTRDAIDERLRILEGVNGAVYRCIDELIRMRSALPSPSVPMTGNSTSVPPQAPLVTPTTTEKPTVTEGSSSAQNPVDFVGENDPAGAVTNEDASQV